MIFRNSFKKSSCVLVCIIQPIRIVNHESDVLGHVFFRSPNFRNINLPLQKYKCSTALQKCKHFSALQKCKRSFALQKFTESFFDFRVKALFESEENPIPLISNLTNFTVQFESLILIKNVKFKFSSFKTDWKLKIQVNINLTLERPRFQTT